MKYHNDDDRLKVLNNKTYGFCTCGHIKDEFDPMAINIMSVVNVLEMCSECGRYLGLWVKWSDRASFEKPEKALNDIKVAVWDLSVVVDMKIEFEAKKERVLKQTKGIDNTIDNLIGYPYR